MAGSSGTWTSPSPRCFRELDRALSVVCRLEPAPKRAELASEADRALPIAAEPMPPIKPESLFPITAAPASAGFQAATITEPAVDRAAAARLRAFRTVHFVAPQSNRC